MPPSGLVFGLLIPPYDVAPSYPWTRPVAFIVQYPPAGSTAMCQPAP